LIAATGQTSPPSQLLPLQDRRAAAFAEIAQRGRRRRADRIEHRRHAALGQGVARAQYRRHLRAGAAVDRVGEELQGAFGAQVKPLEVEEPAPHLGMRGRAARFAMLGAEHARVSGEPVDDAL
jgi:hypothetical protein